MGELRVHEAALDGRRLTIGKVRQLDLANPSIEIRAVARYRDSSDRHPYYVRVIGELNGRTVRSYVVDRPAIKNWTFAEAIVDADLHTAWGELPLVLL